MTELLDSDVVSEALAIIDRALSQLNQRELVSADEVADLLLDVRLLLTSFAELEQAQLAESVSSS